MDYLAGACLILGQRVSGWSGLPLRAAGEAWAGAVSAAAGEPARGVLMGGRVADGGLWI